MRADRAVEPTKSENITVTWRRSAVSRGDASTGAEPGVAVGLALASDAARQWCQCRFKFPQMCRSKIPQLAGFGDQPAGW